MNKVNEAGYNEATKFGPSENNPPHILDDFQIGPDGAYEHTEDITPKEKVMTYEELQNVPQMISAKMSAQQLLINLLYSQVMDLTLMSKIELGDDVIAEIKRLNDIVDDGYSESNTLAKLVMLEKDLTRMFDSDVKVALALLDEIRKIK